MTANRALALLRIGLGVEFVFWAAAKTWDGWLIDGSVLEELLSGYVSQGDAPYVGFLELVVLPNVDIFARLVTIGEWAVAVTLTLGLFTRFGSLVGMWLMVNFMLMRGVLDVSGSIDRLFFLACLVCLVTSAGQVWGIDGIRRRASRRIANTWANPVVAASAARQPYGQTARATTVASQDRSVIAGRRTSQAPIPDLRHVMGTR